MRDGAKQRSAGWVCEISNPSVNYGRPSTSVTCERPAPVLALMRGGVGVQYRTLGRSRDGETLDASRDESE